MKQIDSAEPPRVGYLDSHGRAGWLDAETGRCDLDREGARGAAMSRTDTLSTMPAIRSERTTFAFARRPDRSAGGQGSADRNDPRVRCRRRATHRHRRIGRSRRTAPP